MLFNSIEFCVFLPIVFVLYWFVTNHNLKLQNALIVASSFLFYGWWDWRFLSLLIFSASVDYFVAIAIAKEEQPNKRKHLLWISIGVNLGLLGFFKYYNFFADSFVDAFTFFGQKISPRSLRIVLPVGISFYTFQALSYSIDVYRKNLEPTKDAIVYFAYISFFPQLVAGPIERATHLLPQFYAKRTFDKQLAIDGLRQMLWGLFKKVVIADNISRYVETIFSSTEKMPTGILIMGLGLFSIQIYADFSGYSDIALGTSRLFGFDLKMNFRYPLFARTVGERWRNWHISLSTWFRDYIYIPLGGSRGTNWDKFKNTLILFTISGFWHGANWTFVLWGIINGLFFAPSMLMNQHRTYLKPISKEKIFPSLKESVQIFTTFWLIASTYIFFRADSITHSKLYFLSILHNFRLPISSTFFSHYFGDLKEVIQLFVFVTLLFTIEWINRDKPHGLYFEKEHKNILLRWSSYYAIIFIIFWFAGDKETFIYFQF